MTISTGQDTRIIKKDEETGRIPQDFSGKLKENPARFQ
jgi:hypothetical protein